MTTSDSRDDRFSLLIASDPDREDVVAEIYFDDKYVALVSQERGADRKVLELPGPGLVEDLICREVDLAGFVEVLDRACARLAGETVVARKKPSNPRGVAFVGAMAYRFPAMLEILDEHLSDQEGEVLPHLFMADVERWAEGEVLRGLGGGLALREVLDFLEFAFASAGPQVEELIAVSFVEHLPRPGEPACELRTMLGPRLSADLRRLD